ncbi:hypothetical protein [Candidatus Poriferisodalis sp.]|uniref:hypothetical protein n=1 Tax=Candidatus Poriferisodalis sp. TaxID=3101277 RepID=UPI003B02C21B
MRPSVPNRLLRTLAGLAVSSVLPAVACTSPPIRVAATSAPTTALSLEVTQTTLPGEMPRSDRPPASLVTAPQGATTGAGDSTATTEAGRLGAAAVPNPAGVVLDGDGLGIVSFGASVEPALGVLIDALGQPVTDTGWIDPFSIYGDCPGSRLRVVEWPGVLAFFGDPEDGYHYRDPAGEHFMSWHLGTFGPDPYMLRTAAGIGVGSMRDHVAAAYPAATFIPGTADAPPSVILDATDGELAGVFDSGGRIRTLAAGTRCVTR